MARSRNTSGEHSAAGPIHWSGALVGRLGRAVRTLPHERRLAAGAALGLFVTLFLPWYQETVIVAGLKAPSAASVTGWGNFSFVEAAVLLVAAGVLTLLVQRAEGRAFHLPGGDGGVIMAGGLWACALMVWQVFDRPSASLHGQGVSVSGVEWGIFVALGVAALLAYSGTRIRAAHRPEPPLPWDVGAGPLPDGGPARGEARTRVIDRDAPVPVRAGATPGEGPRPPGWLSAPPKHLRPSSEGDQLTIPLDPEA